LYSTTLTHTSSADTSISSSLNYKGNVFYNKGVVTITDTGSYGGFKYTDFTTGSFSVKFRGTHTIFTTEYTLVVKPNEFKSTSNPTIRKKIGDNPQHEGQLYANNLTSSQWNPYVNSIGLYNETSNYPLMVARYSQPIQMRDDMNLIFKVRMDF